MRDVIQSRRKDGYTLIEVTVGLTVTASTVLLAVQLIHRSFSFSSTITQHQNQMRSFGHFSGLFRHDVQHASKSVLRLENRVELDLANDKRALYEIANSHVWRRVFREDQIQQQDGLSIPDDLEAVFIVGTEPDRLTLRLQSQAPVALPEPVMQSQTTAVVGIRRRDLAAGDRNP